MSWLGQCLALDGRFVGFGACLGRCTARALVEVRGSAGGVLRGPLGCRGSSTRGGLCTESLLSGGHATEFVPSTLLVALATGFSIHVQPVSYCVTFCLRALRRLHRRDWERGHIPGLRAAIQIGLVAGASQPLLVDGRILIHRRVSILPLRLRSLWPLVPRAPRRQPGVIAPLRLPELLPLVFRVLP